MGFHNILIWPRSNDYVTYENHSPFFNARNGSATVSQQTDGEPVQEVGHGHGQESSGVGEVMGLSALMRW